MCVTYLTAHFLRVTVALVVAFSGNATGGDLLHSERLPLASQQGGGKSLSAVTAPAGWHKVDAGPFLLFAPPGWEFHQLPGVDSYVGEIVGDGVTLRFDFGGYSSGYLKKAKKPAYVMARESIGGFAARIVSPKTPGQGLTGVYFPNVGQSNGLCLWGQDLTSAQQELVLKIFETIRFGGAMPRYVNPPPAPRKNPQ